MRFKGITVLIYAFLVLVGGIIGYIKAQSAMSLMTGVLSSLFLSACAFAIFRNRKRGFYFAIFITSMLTIFFGYRLFLSHNFMPAGLMTFLGALVLVILVTSKKKNNNDLEK